MLVCALILLWEPRVLIGFQHSFWPVPSKFLFHAVFFAVGVVLYRNARVLQRLRNDGLRYFLLSVALYPMSFCLIRMFLNGDNSVTIRLAPAVAVAAFATFATLGAVGVFLRQTTRAHPVVRYVAGASFWVYLVHHPLVALIQIALDRVRLLPEAKFVTVLLAAAGLSLLSYHFCVRSTWIGLMLNGGARSPRSDKPAVAPLSPNRLEELKPPATRAA